MNISFDIKSYSKYAFVKTIIDGNKVDDTALSLSQLKDLLHALEDTIIDVKEEIQRIEKIFGSEK